MATQNLYATLAEYKSFATARAMSASTDATDDAVISAILEQISRYIDGPAGANVQFYPSYETRLYDAPNSRDLKIDGPLLEVVTFLNGDGSTIAASQYTLHNPNKTPYWKIALKDNATIGWYATSGSFEQALSLAGVWGYRTQYAQRGWVLVGTLGAAITDTTTLAFTMTTGHTVAVGQILKIGSELYNVSTVSTNTITPNKRGDNGSTAATHLISTSVYAWNAQEEIKLITLSIAQSIYALRSGQASSGRITVTNAGLVIRPEDVPAFAQKVLDGYRSPL